MLHTSELLSGMKDIEATSRENMLFVARLVFRDANDPVSMVKNFNNYYKSPVVMNNSAFAMSYLTEASQKLNPDVWKNKKISCTGAAIMCALFVSHNLSDRFDVTLKNVEVEDKLRQKAGHAYVVIRSKHNQSDTWILNFTKNSGMQIITEIPQNVHPEDITLEAFIQQQKIAFNIR